ncbi:MAG: tetratricopeptide repeat protein [Armatimonadetes bacterium]|nr:tetratricopeptide repeat protein [Armatimonadota bacterium]
MAEVQEAGGLTMKAWIIAGSMAGAVAFGTQTNQIRSIVNPSVRATGLEVQDSHAAASLLGQFRTNISSFLYVRTDLYLHGGVEMRPLTNAEEKEGKKGVGHAADETEQIADDDHIVTVIPSAKEDFRGILGDVERATASYKDMTGHHHQSPGQTLPLFRVMTWLDPQFVDGWTTAGYIILWDKKPGCVEKSLAFLESGLEENPNSVDILGQIAYCYLREIKEIGYEGRNYKQALPYLEKARKIGLENRETLSDTEKEALEENYRRLSVCYRELGDYQKMAEVAAEGLQMFGQDGSLRLHFNEAQALMKGKKVDKSALNLPDPEVGK